MSSPASAAREQRSEQPLIYNNYGGDFAAQCLPGGSLVVANSWMIAVRIDAHNSNGKPPPLAV
jgi:hypothetical protein